jgi:hypothetical protein
MSPPDGLRLPILTRAHTEKVHAYRAVEALNPQVPTAAALTTLRVLLDASRTVGTDPLTLSIAAAAMRSAW